MDFNKIKDGFKLYLAEQNEKKGKDIKDDLQLNNQASIFLHSNEFRNYLSTEYQVDTSIMSKSINDILKMDVVNGKLVDVEEMEDAVDFENGDFADVTGAESETASANVSSDGNIPEGAELSDGVQESEDVVPPADVPENGENVNNSSMTDIINEFFEDADIKSVIDADGDGELSADEIQNFLGAASALDGDEENLSIEDLFSAAEIIKNSDWKAGLSGEEDNSVSLNDSDDADDKKIDNPASSPAPASSASSPSSYYGGSPVGGSSGSYGTSGASSPATPVEKTLDNMSADELKAELTDKEKDLSTKQKELSEVTSGETPELKDKQAAIDEAYDKYLEEVKNVDKDLAKELNDKKTEIDNKKQEISDKEAEISENECNVQDAKTAVSNAKSTMDSINSAISSVQNALSGDISDEQKSSYNEKLSSLKSQLQEAESAKKDAETKLEEAEKALETSKDEKKTLEDELKTVEGEMEDIEKKILDENSEIKEYMDDYKQAQEDFDTAKADAISKAQEAVQVAQDAVTEVQNKLNEVLNKAIEASVGGEYNAEAGEKLAKNALNVRGTTGYCLGGVSDTLFATYGEGLPGLGSAYKAAEALRGNTPGYEGIASHFVEKTDYTVDDLPNLPAGAVIVWENNGSRSDGLSTEHGHISISLGDGRESSDHIQNQIRSARNFTVFLPVS